MSTPIQTRVRKVPDAPFKPQPAKRIRPRVKIFRGPEVGCLDMESRVTPARLWIVDVDVDNRSPRAADDVPASIHPVVDRTARFWYDTTTDRWAVNLFEPDHFTVYTDEGVDLYVQMENEWYPTARQAHETLGDLAVDLSEVEHEFDLRFRAREFDFMMYDFYVEAWMEDEMTIGSIVDGTFRAKFQGRAKVYEVDTDDELDDEVGEVE
jgi:hypothetical protein